MTPEQALQFLAGCAAQANMPQQGHINAQAAAQIIREALTSPDVEIKKEEEK